MASLAGDQPPVSRALRGCEEARAKGTLIRKQPMPKRKLDAAFCAAAACEAGKQRTDYWDVQITGFVLECRPGGGKTYTFRYFDIGGRQRQTKIGGYNDITFDQARRKAKNLRAETVLGENPAERKKAKKATPLYSELAEQHIAYGKTYMKRASNTESVISNHLLPRWGKLRLDEIRTQDIAKWLADRLDAGMAPATAEKLRVTLNRSFELAQQWNLPGAERNPVRNVPRRRFNNARERYLTSDEAKRLLAALETSENTQLKSIVGLLLLTGARKNELLKAKWKDVHLDRRAWYIPTTKTGKPRHVPLSQQAIDIIKSLPRWKDCEWLIPNPKTREPFYDLKRPWDTARDEAGLPGLRVHDLRHSAASFMINAGIDLFAVGRILGHADHQSTMRYSHLANETLMQAVEAGAAKLNVEWAGKGGDVDGLSGR